MPSQQAPTATVGTSSSTNSGPDRRLLIDGELLTTGRVFPSAPGVA